MTTPSRHFARFLRKLINRFWEISKSQPSKMDTSDERFVHPETHLNCSRDESEYSCAKALGINIEQRDWVMDVIRRDAGSVGQIYTVWDKRNPDDKYIMKYIVNKYGSGKICLDNEVRFQNLASTLGLAPRVLDAWLCKQNNMNSIIVMDFVGGITLEKFLSDSHDSHGQTFANFKKIMQLFRILYLLNCKVYKLNQAGVIHHDLNFGNILVKLAEDSINVIDVHLIDFGRSVDTNYIFQDIYTLKKSASLPNVADVISEAYKTMNIDRTLTIDLLKDKQVKDSSEDRAISKSRQNLNTMYETILNSVIYTFYDNFILPKVYSSTSVSWSDGSYENYVDYLHEVVKNNIEELIADHFTHYFSDIKSRKYTDVEISKFIADLLR
jgi:serine/threonine protein kinase